MITKQNKGFTLLEILLVIAAIGILAAIVLVAINPNRQIAQVRNAERRSEVNTIYKALEQYLIEKQGYPAGITETEQDICINNNTTGCVNLGVLVPDYVAGIPVDPRGTSYKIGIVDGRVRVRASEAELGVNIAISGSGGTVLGGTSPSDPYWNNVSLLLNFDGPNGSTTFSDTSINSNIATAFNGMQISTAQSKFGGASGYIANSNSYLSIPSSTALQIGNVDYTIELFVYLTTGASGGMVVTKGNPYVNTEFALMYYFGNDLRYYPTNSVGTTFTGSAVGQPTPSPNTWYHVAICRSGNTHRFYLDGVLQTTVNATPTVVTNDPLLIGLSPWSGTGWSAPAGIYIDELRITKDIARYTSNFTPPTVGLPTQ
jgi:prepilin-type N-terminal cleavage/methylation domain-containing protein